MILLSIRKVAYMPKDYESTPDQASLLASRPDKETEEIINTAVRMVMEVGMAAAEAYLHRHNVNKWTALRVLSHSPETRRKPR